MTINERNKALHLTEEQWASFYTWQSTKGYMHVGAIGGAFSLEFVLTGIGPIVKGKCIDGDSIDLTDYSTL